ncbi:MAG: spore coat U domain-containing protein [Bacteroidota bacterium]
MRHSLSLVARGAAIAAALGALVLPSAAPAATATGSFQVTANVTATCLVSSTSNVAFGAYDTTVATNLQATGTVSVTCTRNTAITSIDLNLGVNASGATRRMTDGTDFITYELYRPASAVPGAACAYTAVWGSGAVNGLVPAAAPSNAARTFNVCGQTTQGQNVGAGSYADTVTVTVNY